MIDRGYVRLQAGNAIVGPYVGLPKWMRWLRVKGKILKAIAVKCS